MDGIGDYAPRLAKNKKSALQVAHCFIAHPRATFGDSLNYSIFMKYILFVSLFLLFAAKPANTSVDITQQGGGAAIVEWEAFGSSGNYTVQIAELATSTQVWESQTTNLSTTVTGLNSGWHRYKIVRGCEYIIVDDNTP